MEGQSIRFCQQCGRFQLLEEFDGDRRSCRRKLSKHNERRRRAESMAAAAEASGVNKEGSSILSEPGSPSKDASQGAKPSHGRSMRAAAVMGNARVASIVKSLSSDTEFLQALNPTFAKGLKLPNSEPEVAARPHRPTDFREESQGLIKSTEGPLDPNRVIRPSVVRAIRGLESGSGGIYGEKDIKRGIVPAATIPNSLNHDGAKSEPNRSSAFKPYGSRGKSAVEATHDNFPKSFFDGRLHTYQSTASCQTHAMRGMMPSLGSSSSGGGIPDAEVIRLLSALVAAQQAQQSAGPSALPYSHSAPISALQSLVEGLGSSMGKFPVHRATPVQGLSSAGLSDPALVSLSIKLYNTTPDRLPQSMYDQLRLLGTNSSTYTEISSRPGCAHITVSYLTTEEEREQVEGDIRAMVDRMLSRSGMANSFPRDAPVLLQFHSEDHAKAAVIYNGELSMILDLTPPCKDPYLLTSPIPTHLRIIPLAIAREKGASKPLLNSSLLNRVYRQWCGVAGYNPQEGQEEQSMGSMDGASFLLVASNIDDAEYCFHQDLVLCRQGGRNVILEIKSKGLVSSAEGFTEHYASTGWIHMCIPASEITTAGVYTVEIQRKPFVSAPAAIAVVESEAVAAEVRQLERLLDVLSPAPEFTCLCTMVVQNVGLVSAWYSSTKEVPRLVEEMTEQGCEQRMLEVAIHVAAMSLHLNWPHVLDMALKVASDAVSNQHVAAVVPKRVLDEYQRVSKLEKWQSLFARWHSLEKDGRKGVHASSEVCAVLTSWASIWGIADDSWTVGKHPNTRGCASSDGLGPEVEKKETENDIAEFAGGLQALGCVRRDTYSPNTTPGFGMNGNRQWCIMNAVGLALVPLLFPQAPLLVLFMLLPMVVTTTNMGGNAFMSKQTVFCCLLCSVMAVTSMTSMTLRWPALERVRCYAKKVLQNVPMLRAVSIGAWSCAVSRRLQLQSWARFIILLSNSVAATVSDLAIVTDPQISVVGGAHRSPAVVLGVFISCVMLSTFFPLFLVCILTHRKLLHCSNMQSSKTTSKEEVD